MTQRDTITRPGICTRAGYGAQPQANGAQYASPAARPPMLRPPSGAQPPLQPYGASQAYSAAASGYGDGAYGESKKWRLDVHICTFDH